MNFLTPDWPAPEHVKAFMTTRSDGVSLPPYDSFNLATHVGDDLNHVLANRSLLVQALHLPSEPCWINQVHGVRVLNLDSEACEPLVDADGSSTRQYNKVLAILTADCLPVFITNRSGSFIMLLHAGWRGVADDIIGKSVSECGESVSELMAWIGPGIGKTAFECGVEVRDEFLANKTGLPDHFQPSTTQQDKFLGNLSAMAQWQCRKMGMYWVGASAECTYLNHQDFFSFRREGATGRMASLIWLSN
jgi:polyphenol oxidase